MTAAVGAARRYRDRGRGSVPRCYCLELYSVEEEGSYFIRVLFPTGLLAFTLPTGYRSKEVKEHHQVVEPPGFLY